MPTPSPDCQTEACTLQDCLGTNTYTPEKCNAQMRKLYECCESMYASKPDAESTACPMRSVGKRWLDRHPAENNGTKS